MEGSQKASIPAQYIDHTINSPSSVRRICDIMADRDVAVLDAPVSGGMEGAQTRDLTVLVGGDFETLKKW